MIGQNDLSRRETTNISFWFNQLRYQCSPFLVNRVEKIVRDFGGLHGEAFFAGKPYIMVFDHIIWPKTMKNQYNQLAKPSKADIMEKLSVPVSFDLVV